MNATCPTTATTVRIMRCVKPDYRFLQRGASLLEGIAYLGIAAIVVLGAVSLLISAFGSAQTNRATEELVGLRTATNRLFMGQGGYGAAVLTDQLIAARVQPTSLAIGGAAPNRTLTNAWNGAVVITGAGAQFTVSYAAVPEDVCITLLTSTAGWASVQVTGQAARNVFPITPIQADADCGAVNLITWTGN